MSSKQDADTHQDAHRDLHEAQGIARVWNYAQERFPPALVTMLSASFACASLGLFWPHSLGTGRWWLSMGLLTLVYLALLLRYRVVDEWKDFHHDARMYPGRPVPRGSISPRALIVMGGVAVCVEFGGVLALGGWRGLLLYVPVIVMSGLTTVEFFAKDWLERHFTIAFVVHQLVYIPMFGWAALMLDAPLNGATALGIAAGTALFASAEVVRKFQPRADTEGNAVPDTYSVVWGRARALAVVVILIALSGALAHLVAAALWSLVVSGIAVVLILAKHRSDSWVMGGAGAHVPLLAVAMLS